MWKACQPFSPKCFILRFMFYETVLLKHLCKKWGNTCKILLFKNKVFLCKLEILVLANLHIVQKRNDFDKLQSLACFLLIIWCVRHFTRRQPCTDLLLAFLFFQKFCMAVFYVLYKEGRYEKKAIWSIAKVSRRHDHHRNSGAFPAYDHPWFGP